MHDCDGRTSADCGFVVVVEGVTWGWGPGGRGTPLLHHGYYRISMKSVKMSFRLRSVGYAVVDVVAAAGQLLSWL